jgi:hypothetical protein
VYGHPRESVINEFMHLVDDHLVQSLEIVLIHIIF